MSPLQLFTGPTRRWFEETFEEPTPVQAEGWKRIQAGEHALLIAPTGSGKTLAAFLWTIDALGRQAERPRLGVRTLYVSPLKALVYDVERNLRAPLVGIQRAAAWNGEPFDPPDVDIRTGDTTARDRRRQARTPAEILVTTPESLFLLLGSQARETLRSVDTVIVDEVHALAPTKRGAHLALSLERLAAYTAQDPQRIGLSATARPTTEVACFLGGDRSVSVVDTTTRPRLDLEIVVPVDDLTAPGRAARGAASVASPARIEEERPGDETDPERDHSIWPHVYPKLLELIAAHRTTIVFVNSRGLAERLAHRLNDLALGSQKAEGSQEADTDEETEVAPLVRAHHGSIAHKQRKAIEESLKQGELKAIVATSSLELGIDMGTVDLVVMVESPGAAARGLQRIGRAGHAVGEVSIGRLFPKHRGDLLEAAVVGRQMLEGEIEPLRVPQNPLDVLAQQVVASCAVSPTSVEALESWVRRAAPFRELPSAAFTGVLDMLAGRYPSHDFADLQPRVVWDRDRNTLEGRRGSRMLAAMSGGTIPDRGLYAVHLGHDGPRLGELDEEMVHETIAGQTFTLGASTWRVREITRDRVIVQPAPGETGKLPFWHGEGPGRPLELGRAMGAFTRELASRTRSKALRWLQDTYPLDSKAAKNLVDYVHEQQEVTGTVPTDRSITVERFRDELGDWRICILSPFGARVHAPWGLSLQARLGARAGFDVQTMWSDDGIVLSLPDGEDLPAAEDLLPDAEEVENAVVEELAQSSLFASQFRENAARALLLPRRRPGARTPLWQQRLRAQKLLAVARQFPSFPIVIETYRACLKDVFDLPALKEVARGIATRQIQVTDVETRSASPFARSLVFAYVGANLYEGDVPLAERRARALSLDTNLLRELLGQEELRELLDASVIDELEEELQYLSEERQARHADALHDLMRRLGDLTDTEIEARVVGPATEWLSELTRARRTVRIRIGGEARWIAAEDAAVYRDALGVALPVGVPQAFLSPRPDPLQSLVHRYARTHGPFTIQDVARRFRVPPARIAPTLRALELEDRISSGDFRPGEVDREWCDTEVLRRIKRRTLAKLRNEVAPVERAVLGRFLPAWHGVGAAAIGARRLEEVITQLEGLPLSFRELEASILPARVRGYSGRALDQLGASGWLVWIGHGSLGSRDGRVALYRRERVARMVEPPVAPDALEAPHHAILERLRTRGASFFGALVETATPHTREELVRALWDLVWAGLVTNDTFEALRALRDHRGGPERRARRRQPEAWAGGRWSLVSPLLEEAIEPTERAYARAATMLERHGLVSREVAALESLPGGYGRVYRVLRAMEEAGKVRRGYFVDGLGGAQFAYLGAVDRLRGLRNPPGEPEVVLLSAMDPANPFGWIVPWPAGDAVRGANPRRIAGASVVLVNGELVLYLDRGGRRLRTFVPPDNPEAFLAGLGALEQVARRSRGKILRIEEIDGEAARTSGRAELMRKARFSPDHRGLCLEAS